MHRIAIPVTPGLPMFELAIPCEVFEPGREDFPVPWWYELQLCAVQDGPVRTAEGLLFDSPLGLEELSAADTVIIPGCADRQDDAPEALLQALRVAYDRGARIASICTGAFILAAAGLLDGRTVTTHWMHAGELTRRWPAVQDEPSHLRQAIPRDDRYHAAAMAVRRTSPPRARPAREHRRHHRAHRNPVRLRIRTPDAHPLQPDQPRDPARLPAKLPIPRRSLRPPPDL